jgi:arylsulfatase A-like enzyme
VTRPNIVLVVLDTVRRDRISAYGYERATMPTFDEFASTATLFEDAVTQSSWSIPAHASLLTGLAPSAHQATTVSPVLRARRPLPAVLSSAGYETYAVSPNEFVRPATGFGDGFDEFHACSRFTVPESVVSVAAPLLNRLTASPLRRPVERGFNWRREHGEKRGVVEPPQYGVPERIEKTLDQSREPFFLFVNLPHAHLPRSPDPTYRDQFVEADAPTSKVVKTGRTHTFGDDVMDEQAIAAMSDLYDADLRTLDDRLSTVLDVVDEHTVDGETLVVLVSDHGEHLGERGLVGHHHSLFEPVLSVPLAIDFPENGPETVDAQVETRRVYHTIVHAAGVRSFPDLALDSGQEDAVARGSFHSPMLDMRAFLDDRRIAYDRRYLGEPLTVRRTASETVLQFDDTTWTVTREDGAPH